MNQEHLPGNIRKTRWQIQAEGEVEEPIANGSDTLQVVSDVAIRILKWSKYHSSCSSLE